MNISENLFPLLVALVIRTESAHDRKKTSHCPCDERAWSMREKLFGCEKRNYTCILTEEDELIETCIAPYRIFEKEDGCPYVKTFVQDFGPQIGGRLSPCDVRGCPPTNHSAYYITEIYKYPACWIPMAKRANADASVDFKTMCFTTKDIDILQQLSIPNGERTHGNSLLVITVVSAVCVTVVVIIISVIILKRNRQKQRKRQENELSTKDALLSQTCSP